MHKITKKYLQGEFWNIPQLETDFDIGRGIIFSFKFFTNWSYDKNCVSEIQLEDKIIFQFNGNFEVIWNSFPRYFTKISIVFSKKNDVEINKMRLIVFVYTNVSGRLSDEKKNIYIRESRAMVVREKDKILELKILSPEIKYFRFEYPFLFYDLYFKREKMKLGKVRWINYDPEKAELFLCIEDSFLNIGTSSFFLFNTSPRIIWTKVPISLVTFSGFLPSELKEINSFFVTNLPTNENYFEIESFFKNNFHFSKWGRLKLKKSSYFELKIKDKKFLVRGKQKELFFCIEGQEISEISETYFHYPIKVMIIIFLLLILSVFTLSVFTKFYGRLKKIVLNLKKRGKNFKL